MSQESLLSEVQNFYYRGPRLAVRLPVSLRTETCTYTGHTRNLSEDGVLVRLDGPVAPQTDGQLTLNIGPASFALDVVATYNDVFDVGFEIRFSSSAERDFFQKFVKTLFRNSS
jgi:hypothetical protein